MKVNSKRFAPRFSVRPWASAALWAISRSSAAVGRGQNARSISGVLITLTAASPTYASVRVPSSAWCTVIVGSAIVLAFLVCVCVCSGNDELDRAVSLGRDGECRLTDERRLLNNACRILFLVPGKPRDHAGQRRVNFVLVRLDILGVLDKTIALDSNGDHYVVVNRACVVIVSHDFLSSVGIS